MTRAMSQPVTSGATTRKRIIEAAVAMTTESGWSGVTMGRLADRAGVSRQTVYNEVGSKPALADAVVMDELGRFMAVVEQAFDAHPGDLVASVRASVRGVLERAQDSSLVRAIVSATSSGDNDLLPPLTTRADSLIDAAKGVLTLRLAPYARALDARQLASSVDVLVRTVLSQVIQPSGSPKSTADDLAWVSGRLLQTDT